MNSVTSARPQSLMIPAEVSALLGIPEGTLANWRYQGNGPKSIKIGRHVRYRLSDIERWLESREKV